MAYNPELDVQAREFLEDIRADVAASVVGIVGKRIWFKESEKAISQTGVVTGVNLYFTPESNESALGFRVVVEGGELTEPYVHFIGAELITNVELPPPFKV